MGELYVSEIKHINSFYTWCVGSNHDIPLIPMCFGLHCFRFPSTIICKYYIVLVEYSLSRLCTCPNHINLFFPRNSAIGYYMCASFQMSTFLTCDPALVFLLPTSACTFQLYHLDVFQLMVDNAAEYEMCYLW